jgi:ribosomal protein L37E
MNVATVRGTKIDTTANTESANRCQACGKRFSTNDRFCADCGAVRAEAPDDAYAQEPERERDSRSSHRLIGGIASAVAVIGIGVGVALAISGGSNATTRTVTAPVVTGVSSTAQTLSSANRLPLPSTPRPSPEASPPSTRPSLTPRQRASSATAPRTRAASTRAAGPLAALDAYWADVAAHDFRGAYGHLLPGSIGQTQSASRHETAGCRDSTPGSPDRPIRGS